MTKSPEFNANPPGVFLLGVGAQKAGTIAELKRFRQLNAKPLQPRTWVQPRTWLRQWFIHNPEHYADYFQWLLSRPRLRGAQIRLTGDITPSYALLSADTLKAINTSFQARGIPVKPVFLMREPIERLISSQRMKLRKQGLRDAATEVASLRKRVAKGRGLRSDYGQTLEALDQA